MAQCRDRNRVNSPVIDLRDQYDLPSKRGIQSTQVGEPGCDRQVLVFRQVRGDPLGEMYVRGHIDDVTLQAGLQYQRRYELAHLSGVSCALGRSSIVRVPRFGGGNVRDRQLDAAKWLKSVERELGPDLHQVIHDVCAAGRSLRQIAGARGLTQYRARMMFRNALSRLTELCGLATSKAA